jgi:hypothetical protein
VVPGSGKRGWRERAGCDGIGDGWRGEEVLMVNLSVDGFVFEDVMMGNRITKDAGLKEKEMLTCLDIYLPDILRTWHCTLHGRRSA